MAGRRTDFLKGRIQEIADQLSEILNLSKQLGEGVSHNLINEYHEKEMVINFLPLINNVLYEIHLSVDQDKMIEIINIARKIKFNNATYLDHLLKDESFLNFISEVLINDKYKKIRTYLNEEKINLTDAFKDKLADPKLDGIILQKIINYKMEDHDYYQDTGNKLPPIYNDLLALKNAGNINGMKQVFLLVIKMEGFNALYSDLGDINVRNNISNPVIKEVMSELLKHDDIRLNLLPIEINNSLKDIKNLIPNNPEANKVIEELEKHLKDEKKVFNIFNFKDLKKFSEDLNKGLNDFKNAKTPNLADKILDSIINVIGVFTDKVQKYSTHAKADRAEKSIDEILKKGPISSHVDQTELQKSQPKTLKGM